MNKCITIISQENSLSTANSRPPFGERNGNRPVIFIAGKPPGSQINIRKFGKSYIWWPKNQKGWLSGHQSSLV